MTTPLPPSYICPRDNMAIDRDRIIMRENIVRTEINLTIQRFERYLANLTCHHDNHEDIRKQLEFDLVRLRIKLGMPLIEVIPGSLDRNLRYRVMPLR